ncbi:MAG: hypothetical protein GY866_14130 [Proteobacteria bacterium]|nr:hypothetical protein [Pseudomonadota bacterium]
MEASQRAVANEGTSSDRRTRERRQSEGRNEEMRIAQKNAHSTPDIVLNTGFIILLQLIVIMVFCN